MKLKWGALAVDGRGKIGGQVAARNRSGAYLRNKVTPNNPSTMRQSLARTVLSTLSSAWKSLEEVERDAWNAAVDSWEKTNVFGDTVKPTGKNLFTQLNIVRKFFNEGQLDTPPEKGSVPDVSNVEADYVEGSTNEFSVSWDTDATSGEGVIWATEPMSPGVSYAKRKFRRLVNIPDISVGNIDILSEYEDRFGAAAVGQAVFVRVQPALKETGQVGRGIDKKDIKREQP